MTIVENPANKLVDIKQLYRKEHKIIMVNYKEVKCSWSSGAAPIEGLCMETVYSIVKNGNKYFLDDGNYQKEWDVWCITHNLSPINVDDWSDVDFEEFDESKKPTNIIESKNFKFNKK